jgi:glycosyltransferase involved in cell wall biosynthesis
MTVSVALIVRDEERTLGRCLDSLAGAVDEFVVVDTGSLDATKQVARRYTDRVFDFEWRQDFAAARQFAFERATGEWIAWVDADDVVVNAERIRPALAAADPSTSGFYWRYVYERDGWGNPLCELWRERCVRNDGEFRWEGRVHEVLTHRRPSVVLRDESVYVEHRRERALIPQKLRRNLSILEAEHREPGADSNPRHLFYLASEYASAGETEKALGCFYKYLRVAEWDDERYQAQTRVAALYRSLRRYAQALDADLSALKICPHWPDAYFGLAQTYYHLNDWHRVVHWAELGRRMPLPDTLLFTSPMAYRFDWLIFYTNALFHIGEVREALSWTRRALELRPDDPWHRQNFLAFADALAREGRRSHDGGATHVRGVTPAQESARESDADGRRGSHEGAPLRVVWEGLQFHRSSFAVVNREMCSHLLGLRGGGEGGGAEVELRLLPHGPPDYDADEDPQLLGPLARRFHAPLSGPADAHVRMTHSPVPEPPPAGRWVIFQPWDSSSMPADWYELFAHHADEIWVPSNYVRRCYVEDGVGADKVQVIPHGIRTEFFNPRAEPLGLRTKKSFRFLFVGGTLWRKGVDVLLAAYTRAFSRADDVCLVIKDVGARTYYRDCNYRERIRELVRDPSAPEILYLTTDVADRVMPRLYRACDCLVHPFRGEGFALPVLEAMGCGLPVVVTSGGPCDDYCTDETAYRLPASLVSAWDCVTRSPAFVLEPDADALAERLRHVYAHREEARLVGERAARSALLHTWERSARMALDRLAILCGRRGPRAPLADFPPCGRPGGFAGEALRV